MVLTAETVKSICPSSPSVHPSAHPDTLLPFASTASTVLVSSHFLSSIPACSSAELYLWNLALLGSLAAAGRQDLLLPASGMLHLRQLPASTSTKAPLESAAASLTLLQPF